MCLTADSLLIVIKAKGQQFICCSIDGRVSRGFRRRRSLVINNELEKLSLKSRYYIVSLGIVIISI